MTQLSKKGSIGDGIAWVAAFLIIFFIMIIFLLAVGILIPQTQKNKLDLEVTKPKLLSETSGFSGLEIINFSKEKPEFLKMFLEEDKEEVYSWADSYYKIDLEEGFRINTGEEGVDPNAEEIYDKLLEKYKSLIVEYNFSEPYFYIKTGDKDLGIEKFGDEFDVIYNPQDYDFNLDENNAQKYIIDNSFFIVSDKGTLIMIIFYDKGDESVIYGI